MSVWLYLKRRERHFGFLLRNLLIKRLLINSLMPGETLKFTAVFNKCLNKVYSLQWRNMNGNGTLEEGLWRCYPKLQDRCFYTI